MIPLRTILEYVSGFIAMAPLVLVLNWLADGVEQATTGRQLVGRFVFLLFACIASVTAGVLIWAYFLPHGFAPAGGAHFPVLRVISGTIVIAVLALGLFKLRLTRLRWYAIIELTFGATVAALTMYSATDEIGLAQALGILTSVFVLVRGMDNFKKDLEERRKKSAGVPAG